MHSSYLITSREGLYLLNPPSITKLRDGYFFGIARTTSRWYTFQYTTRNKNEPTDTGVIESFLLDEENNQVHDVRVEATGLDNGSHQITIYQDRLYLLETYYQRIRVFHIDQDTGVLTPEHIFSPTSNVVNAHYLQQGCLDPSVYTCNGYWHMNALTVQDNLIYVSCPRLRNALDADGKPSHHRLPHKIQVYTMDFSPLWQFVLPKEYFCHDLVFVGHHVYLTSPPNKLVRFDIVDKTVSTVAVLPTSCLLPRGLSIHPDGTIYIGSRDQHHVYTCSVDGALLSKIQLPSSIEPCCIVNVSLECDYYHTNSQLRSAYVEQISVADVPIFASSPFTNEWKKTVFRHTPLWQTMPTTPKYRDPRKKYTENTTKDVTEITSPAASVFEDICTYQTSKDMKIPLEYLPSTVEKDTLWKSFQSWRQEIEREHQVSITGKLYIYPPKHHLGWHTNLEDPCNYHMYRAYVVATTEDNQTFFLYRHPISKAIHAVPDRDGFVNVFFLGSKKHPLWHAVINPSHHVIRLSLGISLQPKQLPLLVPTIQKTSHR